MAGSHLARASEAGPIQEPVTESAVLGGALEGMIEFVPGYERRRPPGAEASPLDSEAVAAADAPDEVLLPAGRGPVTEGAFELEVLYDAGSLRPLLHLESVFGTDDRALITPTTEAPWRAICALRMTTKRGEKLVGTGWLIDRRTVITAGHCVFSHDLGGWMASVEVIPALDGAQRPLGSVVATRLRAVDGWIKDRSPEYDYGAILLDRPAELETDFFEPVALSDEELEGVLVNIAGYPADRERASRMYFHARRAQDIATRRVQYDVDTFGGQSGSAVWVILPGGRRVVAAIHTNGISPGMVFNSGTRITRDVLCNLLRWSAEAAPRRSAEAAPGAASPVAASPVAAGNQPAPPGRRTVTVEGPILRLTGKVVDSAGRPVSGASVAISAGSVPYPEIAATSGEDGSFALPITLPGRYEVSVYPDEDSAAGVTVVPDQPSSGA